MKVYIAGPYTKGDTARKVAAAIAAGDTEAEVCEAALHWYRALTTLGAAAELVERAKLIEVLRDMWQKRA